jgi:membrane protease YdiL (CAAX protease family)
MSTLVKKYPAISLLVLSLVIGVGIVALVLAGALPSGFLQLAAMSGSVAAIILAAIEGRKSVRELLRRALIWRVGIQWWVFALLAFAPLIVAALYLYNLWGGPAVDWSGVGPLASFVPLLLFLVIFAGFGEEFGWRGYLLPRLQARYSALLSTLIVCAVWALWHIVLFFVEGTGQYEWAQEVGFAAAYFTYAVALIGWSIMYTWVFNNTKGSVLLAAVVHGAGNAWAGYLDNYRGSFGNMLAFAAVLFIVGVIIVIVAGPEHLSRKNKRNVLELEEENV